MKLPKEFAELLSAFEATGVEYLVVGGYAVAHHGLPRATNDLDLFIGGAANLERVASALERFGLPRAFAERALGLGDSEVLWFGKPPLRVDLLRSISGVDFQGALARSIRVVLDGQPTRVIALPDLIANKRAAGRPQDIADAVRLERTQEPS